MYDKKFPMELQCDLHTTARMETLEIEMTVDA